MTEKIFTLEAINPVDIFGVNEKNLEQIRKFFPKIKLISRGEIIKANVEVIKLILEINNNREPKMRKELLEKLIWQSESIIINLRIACLKQLTILPIQLFSRAVLKMQTLFSRIWLMMITLYK